MAQERSHPRQDVLDGVGIRHLPRELREHLVGRGSIAVDEPVREPSGTLADRVERDGDHRGGGDREQGVVRRSDGGPDPHHDPQVDRREEGR